MTLLNNVKIGSRLALGFALVLTLCLAITLIGLWQVKAIGDASREMMDWPVKKERMASDWSRNIASAVVRTTAVAKADDPALSPFFAAAAAESAKRSTELIKQIEALCERPEEKALFARIVEQRKVYSAGKDHIGRLKSAGQADEARVFLETTFVPTADKYQKMVGEFVTMQRENLDTKARGIEKIENSSLTKLGLLALLALLLGIVCAWWLTSGITGPLRSAVAAARRVADGDLSGRIDVQSTDELGLLQQALNDMNGKLRGIVGQVRSGTDAIMTASTEIAAGNLDLSSRTEQQASSLEETAASMEELTSTVKQNAENARQANQLSVVASEIAGKGGAVVSQVVDTMGSINQSSKKIVDIIGVIDGIAFQTNILALNAAVEAARAGEQGRGFAVVASEVRNLAQRSAAAAKEIKLLIDDSVGKVDAGSKLVGEAGSTMEQIVVSIGRVTDIMAEIMAASHEQGCGIEQINQAVAQMDQVTQQNAALVEEAAAAADAMQEQARSLTEVVSLFTLGAGQATSFSGREPVLALSSRQRLSA